MKLNKHGWSMKEMIIFCSILFVFLLISVFYIMRLYSGLEKTGKINTDKNSSETKTEETGYSYSEIEENVLQASFDLYNEEYGNLESVKITTDRLRRKGYLTSKDLKSIYDKSFCSGYVNFVEGDPSVFIKCKSYETDGYED